MDGPTVAEFVDWLSLNPHIIDKLSADVARQSGWERRVNQDEKRRPM